MNQPYLSSDFNLLPVPQRKREPSSRRQGLTTVLAGTLVLLLCCQGFGATFVILQLATFSLMTYLNGRAFLTAFCRTWPFVLLPCWAMASYFWSISPDNSLRYAAQVMITILMGLSLAASVPLSRLPMPVFAGTSIAVILSMLSGRMGSSEVGPVLIGVTGSKNQLAYLCLMMMFAAAPIALGFVTRRGLLRLAALLMIGVGVALILRSEAATAKVSLVIGAALFATLLVATRMSIYGRAFTLAMTAIVAVGLVAIEPEIEKFANYVVTDVLKKDSTLTGRTLLWRKADVYIAEHPILGVGYRAVWTNEGLETIGLLRMMHITDGRGFHWHDNIRELRVDLGIVGLLLAAVPFLVAVGLLVIALYTRPSWQVSYLVTMIVLIVALRVKTDAIIGPFLIDTAFLFAALGYATRIRVRSPLAPRRHLIGELPGSGARAAAD